VPTYQYVCTKCGHTFEAVQSFSDDALTECPDCGGLVRKKFGAVGVVFKGSGFYRTDSRSGSTSTDLAKPQKQLTSGDSSSGSSDSTSSGSSSGDAGSSKPSTPSSTPAKSTGDAAS
jgi:putative FmdB family regulatory protein